MIVNAETPVFVTGGASGLGAAVARDLVKSGLCALTQTSEFPKRLGRVEDRARRVQYIATNTMLNGEGLRLDAAPKRQAS